jgi:hypothetical protein
MKEYFSAVEGDPLSSSPDSYVMPSGIEMTFVDEGNRSMAFIGGHAYCGKCKSVGTIVGGSGCSETGRLYNEPTRQWQAVAGDFVKCRCEKRPVILARYGKGWVIEDSGGASNYAGNGNTLATEQPSTDVHAHDECLRLRHRRTGQPLSDVRYRVLSNGKIIASGRTNAAGLTQRITTNTADTLEFQVSEE